MRTISDVAQTMLNRRGFFVLCRMQPAKIGAVVLRYRHPLAFIYRAVAE